MNTNFKKPNFTGVLGSKFSLLYTKQNLKLFLIPSTAAFKFQRKSS